MARRAQLATSDHCAIPTSLSALPALAAGTNIIGAVLAAHTIATTWINDVASNTGSAHTIADTVLRGMNELWMHIRLPLGVTGSLTMEGSLDGTNWFPLQPDAEVVRGLVTSTIVLATNVVTLTNPVGAVSLVVPFDSPPPHVRLTYARSSGGSAAGFSAAYSARAA